MRLSDVSVGILYMLASSIVFALMNAFAKLLAEHIPSMENVFFRSLVMLFAMLAVYAYNASRHKPRTQHAKGGWWQLLVRVGLGGVAMACLFYNIATIPLVTAMAFMQSTPLYVAFFSIFFLKERLSMSAITATIIGFVGILLIGNPSLSGISWLNIVFGICNGAFAAIAFVTLRSLKQYFDNSFIILAFGASTTIIGALGILLPLEGIGGFVLPIGIEWLYILLMGLCGTIAQYFLNLAYMNAPAGIVAPVDYSRILFSMALGIMLGDSLPNLPTTCGILLIIAAGLLIATPALLKDLRRLERK